MQKITECFAYKPTIVSIPNGAVLNYDGAWIFMFPYYKKETFDLVYTWKDQVRSHEMKLVYTEYYVLHWPTIPFICMRMSCIPPIINLLFLLSCWGRNYNSVVYNR